jgi:uncharacterized membrane protein YidH (DUF202 family)
VTPAAPGDGRQPETPGDAEEADPGLARERTHLAWTRTAIAFAAAGAAILKTRLVPGLIVLALGAATWAITRFFPGPATEDGARPRRLLLVTVAVTVMALVCLAIAATARVS